MTGPGARLVDLGSGGGVPALPLALALPGTAWVLVEAGRRRVDFLLGAVARLGLADRVQVVAGRAEVVGRDADHRGRADAVTARSFGPPAVTAECAAPLLRPGGVLVVSEPPGGRPERWPARGLAELGLALRHVEPGPPALAVLDLRDAPTGRWPRRPGIPGKRPLW